MVTSMTEKSMGIGRRTFPRCMDELEENSIRWRREGGHAQRCLSPLRTQPQRRTGEEPRIRGSRRVLRRSRPHQCDLVLQKVSPLFRLPAQRQNRVFFEKNQCLGGHR